MQVWDSEFVWPWITACIFSRNHAVFGSAYPNTEGNSRPTLGACLCLFVQPSQQFFSGPTADSISAVGLTVSARRASDSLVCVSMGVVFTCSSLARPHPLFLLLGDLALTNHKARLVLTHKLWVTRLPSNQTAVYNLIGYLLSWEEGQLQLEKSLQSALEVWSDGACVRRMDSQHHLWLCKLLVLGTTCLASCMTTPTSSGSLLCPLLLYECSLPPL